MIKGSECSKQFLCRWSNSGHKQKQKAFLWGLIPRFWRTKRSQRKIKKRLTHP